MQKALSYLGEEFGKLQAGRATPGLVDGIKVDAGYGVMPMNQLANIVVMDNSTIKIEPWDKSLVSKIEKAIYDADTGLTPQGMGDYIIINIVRKVRQDARDDVRKLEDADEISEDEKKGYESDIDDLTKKMNTRIDDAVKEKEEQIKN